MFNILSRLLPLLLLSQILSSGLFAQQRDQLPRLNLGDAVVTGFSGTIAPDPAQRRPANKSGIDLVFINPDGASARIVDVSKPGYVWDGRLFRAPKKFDVFAKDVGQVFGVALDDLPQPNIYLAATSVFGLNIVVRGRDGLPERRKKGVPGAGWMRGQFGLDLQGGPGSIYKVDGRTGAVTLFANVTLDGVPNPSVGLGNLAYDSEHKQLFVSDLHTGMVHRFDLNGKELGHYDHGTTGLTLAKLPPVAFNPKNRPNIASDSFDSEKPDSWGFAPAQRRVWGLAMHDGRLFYSVMAGPQIWSVGIARDGSFASDSRWEVDVPAQAGPLPISDIAFSQKGAMILAQRALVAGAYDYSAFTRPGEPTVFRIWPKGPNDPALPPGRWKPVPEEYAVGFAGNQRNTNGGVALGYGYGRNGTLSTSGCEFSLWTTGQNLRNAPPMRSRLDPGGPLIVHGLQASPSSPVRDFNAPPWTSYFVDYDDRFDDPQAAGHLGSVRIYTAPCPPPATYNGPGYAANPPFIVEPPSIVRPVDCRPNCPTGTPVDIGIEKTGKPDDNVDLGYDFNISVRNLGGPLSGPATLTVTDVVPAGMTFTSVTSTNWNCLPVAPIAAGGTLTCTYTGSFPVAANQLLGTIAIVASGGTGPYKNCATIGYRPSAGPTDGNAANDQSCVTVQKPQYGYLLVKKQVIYRGPLVLPPQTYPVTVTCGSSTTTMNLAADGTPQAVNNLLYGTVCTVNEPTPPTPANVCPPNTTPTWATPVYVPSPSVTINAPSAIITVQNTLNCVPSGEQHGELLVVKKVVYVGPLTLPSQPYPVTATCGSNTNSLSLQNNILQTAFGSVPHGTQCTFNEPTPPVPAGACPPNMTGTWVTTYSPPSPITIHQVTLTETITNTLTCSPTTQGDSGSLVVTKTLINKTQGQLVTTGLTYPISVSCTSGGSPAVVTNFGLTANGSNTVSNIALNSICSVTESPMPTPTGSCATVGAMPTWTTVMTPPSPVSVNGTNVAVTVQNTLECTPPVTRGGLVLVTKRVNNTTSANLSSFTYPVTVSCGSMAYPLTLADNVAQSASNIPIGTTCSATEGAIPLPSGACTPPTQPVWTTTISPAVTIAASPTSITVQNNLACNGGGGVPQTGTLILKKSLKGPGTTSGPAAAVPFPITVSCGGSTSTANLIGGASQTISSLPVGTVCTALETLPTPPANCSSGTVATWDPPTYMPTTVTITAGAAITLTVHNNFTCKPIDNGAKKKPNVICVEPAKLNSRGTACFCPKGMTLKGKTCVDQERRQPHVTPSDVFRVLPGIGFGGHKGGGDPAGGGKGGQKP